MVSPTSAQELINATTTNGRLPKGLLRSCPAEAAVVAEGGAGGCNRTGISSNSSSRRAVSVQSGGSTDTCAKLDICCTNIATYDPGTVFDVPQITPNRSSDKSSGSSAHVHSTIKIEHSEPVVVGVAVQQQTKRKNVVAVQAQSRQECVAAVGGHTLEQQNPSPDNNHKNSSNSNSNSGKSKLLKNYCAIVDGCSRTTPVIWARDSERRVQQRLEEKEDKGEKQKQKAAEDRSAVKKELCVLAPESVVPKGSSNQSGGGGMNFVNIKIEPKSPNCPGGGGLSQATLDTLNASMGQQHRADPQHSAMDTLNSASSHFSAAGQIPVGIAVARQRMHPDPGISTQASVNAATIKDMHGGSRHMGSFVEMIQGQQLGNNIFLSAPTAPAPMIGSWQYPMEAMQMGLQLVREPTTGQYVFVPAMEPYPQAVVWPYANMQPTQPPPIQFLGTSDYLAASTTLHQHTQTSTRLVALPSNDMKQRYLGTTTTGPGQNAANTTTTLQALPPVPNTNSATATDASSIMGLVNKVPSLNSSHLLPSTLSHNTIIKIEDHLANTATLMPPHDHLQGFSAAPAISTPAELLNANIPAGGFLMPHTPMLTPAPTMFDMGNDKPFLANIAQQQRHFQFNLNSTAATSGVKNEMGHMTTADAPLLQTAPDFTSIMFQQQQQMQQHTSIDFTQQQHNNPFMQQNHHLHHHHQQQQQQSSSSLGHALGSVTSLEATASAMGLTSHPAIMLTPPTVIAARSTGGLLTPPSPMPQKQTMAIPSATGQQQQQQISAVPLAVSNLLPTNGESISGQNNNSLLTVCSMDVLSGTTGNSGGYASGNAAVEAQVTSEPVALSQEVVTRSEPKGGVVTAVPPAVAQQDATMQTDTPVCSDEENTQDTAMSEGAAVNRFESIVQEKETSSGEEQCHVTNTHTGEDNNVGGPVNKECQASFPVTAPESSRRAPVDLSGLELLSNSIEAFETIKREVGPREREANEEECTRQQQEEDKEEERHEDMEELRRVERRESLAVQEEVPGEEPMEFQEQSKGPAEETVQDLASVIPQNEQFDGLDILCRLAEQRLVEEVRNVPTTPPSNAGPIITPGTVAEATKPPSPSLEVTPKRETDVNTTTTTTSGIETDFENSPVEKLSDLERNIKQRLADLTRQCEEKRRELDKMEKINPFYRMGYAQSYPVPNKFAMSDDEETRSSRSASVRTPLTPTLLFGTNSNGNGAAFNSSSQPEVTAAKVSSDTESSKCDDSDAINSLEKMSKRKGVLPKRWDDCAETETIVAKKSKGLVGYIFSANKTRSDPEGNNSNKSVPSVGPLIKHGQLRNHFNPSPSSGSTSSLEQPIKFEPIKIKEEILDDDDRIIPVEDLFKANTTTTATVTPVKSSEERKRKKKNKAKRKHHREGEGKRRKLAVPDNRCKLTDSHLDDKEKKTRVLTSMGGLFYAGVLSPIQPPDIYSVVLDGERGNRPHIMSREEVQRDAVLEIIPTDPNEVPQGTRLCAYWSQQYRCLYPGTAAQPGTPDPGSKKQYISVEFDDGDSGRIAMGDIRLLFNEYPIVEYDPNPLMNLGRKGSKCPIPETGFSALIEPSSASAIVDPATKAAEKERKRMKKLRKHLLKKQQLLNSSSASSPLPTTATGTAAAAVSSTLASAAVPCQCQTITNEDGTRRKIKCSDELCKQRRHKKKRKHKRHSNQGRDSPDGGQKKAGESAFPSVAATSVSMEEEEEEDGEEEGEGEEDPSQQEEETVNKSYVVVNRALAVIENEDTEETMDSCSAADDPDFKDPSHKKKDHHSAQEQNKSKIAAFLPARQLWAWAGESYRRSCIKGRVKKQFYKAIQRGKETIEIGDSAVFLSTGRPDRPYIGRITSMWKTNACNMIVRVKWFYHPEETQGCPGLKYPGGLFESPHEDENDVQTISHKCEVLQVYDFIRKLGDDPKNLSMIYDNNDTYYLAGNYDPTALQLTMQPDIPTK